MKTHTREKPYICKYNNCMSSFTGKSNLKKHIKNVHGVLDKNMVDQLMHISYLDNGKYNDLKVVSFEMSYVNNVSGV
jgi:hypothetical protein